ncbi:MAG TPA: hypothetical protein VHW72_15710 [Candidatus Angelobacter sp.]|jgi:hypothetical protein|nr:hypothetical protein [Candidatus Angelobacter sp.]
MSSHNVELLRDIYAQILQDPRYRSNLEWGEPRSGHCEGSIRAHIAELENNLEILRTNLSEEHYWKLKILIHVHDIFKTDSNQKAPIASSQSHASQAKQFLATYSQDTDLLSMVQYHDEGYALWKQFIERGRYDITRFNRLLASIKDLDLFLWFNIVDGCTKSKSREALKWFIMQVGKVAAISVSVNSILEE